MKACGNRARNRRFKQRNRPMGLSCLRAQPVLVGVGDGLPSVSRMDLHEQPVDVALDRALADDQVFGDLGVGEPGGDKAKYFGLTGREPVGKWRWWRGVFRGSAGGGFYVGT